MSKIIFIGVFILSISTITLSTNCKEANLVECSVRNPYLEVIHHLILYPVLGSCILLRPHAKGGYRTGGQDADMDTEITGEWSYYPIPLRSIPILTLLGFIYT